MEMFVKAAPPKTVEQPVQHQRPQQATTAPVHSLPARPVTVHLAADRKEAIKGVRKAMARTMTLANQIPHFSYCDEYNMNTLVEQRGFFKHMAKERGISLSYMPFIIKVKHTNDFLINRIIRVSKRLAQWVFTPIRYSTLTWTRNVTTLLTRQRTISVWPSTLRTV